MITVKDAADRLNISVNTVRNRLSECGGSMEEVFNFYRRKEEAWMEKQEKARTKEQIAADKIAEAMIVPEPKPEPQRSTAPQPTQVSERKALRTYNRAIRALGELSVIRMSDTVLQDQLTSIMDDLISQRASVFEHLVDWDKLAAETEDAR